MKFQLLMPLTIALTVALVVVIKTRKQEHDKADKQNKFESMKVRVTNDVVAEYQTQKITMENRIDSARKEEKDLQTDVESYEQRVVKKNIEVETCQGAVVSLKDGVANLERELQNLRGETSKEKTSWLAKLESLKKELQMPSAVCPFLKKGVDSASKLCDSETEKVEAPKAEAAKPDAPKAEIPKPDAPKAEIPKPDPPKAEIPKPDAPKAEAPKIKAKG
ncbi:uncharacterized protein ACBT44_014000 [Syngnathus typhle]